MPEEAHEAQPHLECEPSHPVDLAITITGAEDIRELCGTSKHINLRFGPGGGVTFSMPEDASWTSLSDWKNRAVINIVLLLDLIGLPVLGMELQ